MNEELEKAKEELDRFLKEHPELGEYQDEINESMKYAESPEERMLILVNKIVENNNRLIKVLNELG